ncbi:hypothetical protein [Raineya sp.]|jgi:hypothetical protein
MKKSSFLSTLFLALLILGGFSACKKKTKDPSPQEKILGKWRMTAWTLRASNSTTVFDLYAITEPCEKDNYLEYKNGGVIVQNEGATKCSPSDPQEETGSYSLSADGKTLTITFGGNTTNFEVLELTTTTKKLKTTEVDNNTGITYTMEVSFSKI